MIGELSLVEIDEVLKNNVLGRIGCSEGGRTYVVPINYAFDGKYIVAHSADGMKIKMMRKNPAICFEVDEMKSFTSWKSVIVWGNYQELNDERDRYYAMKLFVDKMMHVKVSKTAVAGMESINQHPGTHANIKPVIYRIIINEKTGRFEEDWL